MLFREQLLLFAVGRERGFAPASCRVRSSRSRRQVSRRIAIASIRCSRPPALRARDCGDRTRLTVPRLRGRRSRRSPRISSEHRESALLVEAAACALFVASSRLATVCPAPSCAVRVFRAARTCWSRSRPLSAAASASAREPRRASARPSASCRDRAGNVFVEFLRFGGPRNGFQCDPSSSRWRRSRAGRAQVLGALLGEER